MDLELLFSRSPFVEGRTDQFASIRPNLSADLELDPKEKSLTFDLPERFRSANVVVEIAGGGVRKSRAYFANRLALDVVENYAQLQVADPASGAPLSKVYVKVFARLRDGAVRFYKDGYTPTCAAVSTMAPSRPTSWRTSTASPSSSSATTAAASCVKRRARRCKIASRVERQIHLLRGSKAMKMSPRVVAALVVLLTIGFYLALGPSGPFRPPPEAGAQAAPSDYAMRVLIDGIASTAFRGIDSFEITTSVQEFRDGTTGDVRKIPGPTQYGLLTLRFAPDQLGDDLWAWYNSVLTGAVSRRNMSIVLSDRQTFKELLRYNFYRCFPARWLGPRQVSSSAVVALEEISIAYEATERVRAR